MAGECSNVRSSLPLEVQGSVSRRIIPLSLLGEQERPQEPVEIHVTDDAELSDPTGQRTVRLNYGAVIVNGLLLAGGWATPSQLRDFGSIGSTTTFNRTITQAREGLATVSGLTEPIERQGHAQQTKYRLHPSLVFVDKRADEASSVTPLRRKVVGDVPTLAEFTAGSLRLADKVARRTIFSSMIRENVDRPSVRRRLTLFFTEPAETRQQPLEDPDALHALFTTIDRGLTAYLQPTTSSLEEEAIGEAVVAYHRLYGTLLPYMRRSARYFARNYPGHQGDLFQAAANDSVRFLLGFEGGSSPDQCSTFYAIGYTTIHGAVRRCLGDILRHQYAFTRSQYEQLRAIENVAHILRGQLKREPQISEIADALNNDVTEKEIDSLLQLSKRAISLDPPLGTPDEVDGDDLDTLPATNIEADFDLQTDRWLIEDAVQLVFSAESPLSDWEKIVLSLRSQIFSPSLCGAEHHHRPTRSKDAPPSHSFTYPYTSEDFWALLRAASAEADDPTQDDLARILGVSQPHISNVLNDAYRKARRLLAPSKELAFVLGYQKDWLD